MKLNRQEEIALLLSSELAMHANTYVSLADIAATHGVSSLFLKKIARMLRIQGLIRSKEGQSGGYVLARPAEMINAWDIMEAVVGKSSEGARVHGNFSCPLHPTCLPQSIRQLVSESFKRYLQDITLDQFSKKKGIV